jgi:hypothetical protein
MSIITESKATRRLTVLLVMIMGIAMIIPSNLAFASPDDGSDDGGSENQEDGSSDERTTEDDQTEPEETEELPPIDEEPRDPCVEDPEACALEPEPPINPCLDNPDLPECQPLPDPCLDNPDLPECQPLPDPCLDNPDLPECDPCVLYPDLPECIPCGRGTHLDDGECVRDKDNGGSSSSSSSSSSSTTVNLIGAEVSSCKLDGNSHGIQQKFDSIKYQACGLYPNGQIAYTDGFVMGCTQVGNTQQLCQAFVIMNTQHTQTAATQPNMQSTIQPTQAIQPSGVS